MSNRDKELKQIIKEIPEPSFQSTDDVFYDLCCCIIEQQIHYRRKVPVFNAIIESLSNKYPRPENIRKLDPKIFSDKKISRNKYDSLLALSDYWLENKLDEFDWQKASDIEVRQMLSKIEGVGDWTIDMILLFTLGRTDIMPLGDYHLKIIISKVYGISHSNLKKQMKQISDQWQPYRSTAVLYLLDWKSYVNKRT